MTAMTGQTTSQERTLDLVIGIVYGVALGAQIAWIVDEATHGGVRRGWHRLREQAAAGWRRERDITRLANHVIWEATEATMEAAGE